MSEPEEKLCPFDKKECIRIRCAIWSADESVCSLALIGRGVPKKEEKIRPREKSVSSGLSGKYRDPLFD